MLPQKPFTVAKLRSGCCKVLVSCLTGQKVHFGLFWVEHLLPHMCGYKDNYKPSTKRPILFCQHLPQSFSSSKRCRTVGPVVLLYSSSSVAISLWSCFSINAPPSDMRSDQTPSGCPKRSNLDAGLKLVAMLQHSGCWAVVTIKKVSRLCLLWWAR